MRRIALIAAAFPVLALAAAPARADNAAVNVGGFAFSPTVVTIAPGESVTWTFAGPDTNHSTTSDPGQAESWDSDPGNPFPNHPAGDTFARQFAAAGTFTYVCKVHAYMRARVVVAAPGAPPPGSGGSPPAGSPSPGAGDPYGGSPSSGSGGPPASAGDTTAPQLGTLRANARRRRVTFKLDEAAAITAKLRGPTRRDLKLAGRAGTNVLKLPKRLKAGRYALTLSAVDAAGNKTPVARVRFSVKR